MNKLLGRTAIAAVSAAVIGAGFLWFVSLVIGDEPSILLIAVSILLVVTGVIGAAWSLQSDGDAATPAAATRTHSHAEQSMDSRSWSRRMKAFAVVLAAIVAGTAVWFGVTVLTGDSEPSGSEAGAPMSADDRALCDQFLDSLWSIADVGRAPTPDNPDLVKHQATVREVVANVGDFMDALPSATRIRDICSELDPAAYGGSEYGGVSP